MREILFKAKHVHAFNSNSYLDGQWVEGFLSAENYINDGVSDVLINPSTICQYTGLTDKNGNKIWENDVVKCYADTDDLGNDLYFFYKVIWHEIYHCWWLSDIHTLEDEYLHQYNPSDIEAISNIFDNPELLKGE